MPTPRPRIRTGDAAGALTLGALFGTLAAAVATGRTAGVDTTLRRLQRHPRRGARRDFSRGVKVAAKPWVQLPLATLTSYALRRRGVPGASAVLVAAVGVFLADKACKKFVRRQRPPGYRGKEHDESFPSGHTAATAALTFTTARLLERQRLAPPPVASLGALLVTSLVAESRLVLDEHWPSDLVGGALLGGATAFAALALSDELLRVETSLQLPGTSPRWSARPRHARAASSVGRA
ncbi:MAG TPA: phosphatase PAP2 family protein [Gemmatimonadaceae bacterium]